MKKLLASPFRLRGWKGDPFYLEHFPTRSLRRLSLEEFSYLLRCDGKTEITPGTWPPEPGWVRAQGIAPDCESGSELLPEQEYACYPNRRLDFMELSVTGRCNLNCRHCFNAKDCEPRTAEPAMEQLLALLARMEECGVGRLRLTGGEPLVRRDLLKFTAEMARRGIRLYELLTNGYALTEAFLDALEAQGHRPVWFVSFDGLGFHDWLRGVKGAEERALKTIEMLCRRGYYVQVHQCVWKDSLPSVQPTVLRLSELGVSRYRLVTVEPSLRWRELAPGQNIPAEDWMEYIPEFLDWWYETGISMDLDLWSYWVHEHGSCRATIVPDLRSLEKSNEEPACHTNRNKPFIDADGRIVPCMPLSGASDAYGLNWGNVYKGDDLQEIFTHSAFLDQISCSCRELKERNPECAACAWRDRCSTGCRAEAVAQGGSVFSTDRRMCLFYRNGCYEKLLALAEKQGLSVFGT